MIQDVYPAEVPDNHRYQYVVVLVLRQNILIKDHTTVDFSFIAPLRTYILDLAWDIKERNRSLWQI
jgi:hypothetical protein